MWSPEIIVNSSFLQFKLANNIYQIQIMWEYEQFVKNVQNIDHHNHWITIHFIFEDLKCISRWRAAHLSRCITIFEFKRLSFCYVVVGPRSAPVILSGSVAIVFDVKVASKNRTIIFWANDQVFVRKRL